MWGNIWKNSPNFLSMTKDTNLHIREAKCIPKQMRCINTNKITSHPRYIIVKVLKPKIKRKTWKQPEIKESVFSLEQRPDTVKWSVKILKGVRETVNPKILCIAAISFINGGIIRIFIDKVRLKEFITRRPELQIIVKGSESKMKESYIFRKNKEQ